MNGPRRHWMLKGALALAMALALAPAAAQHTVFTGSLSGGQEVPPVASTGGGTVRITLDPVAHLLGVEVSFSDLVGNSTIAHIHCCTVPTAGAATTLPTLVGFPAGVRSGSFSRTYDTTQAATFAAGFLSAHGGTAAGAEAALFAGLNGGQAYFNLHTDRFPAGELRANLSPIPEPHSLLLLGAGLLAVGAFARRRR